jgi:hypothetical protein
LLGCHCNCHASSWVSSCLMAICYSVDVLRSFHCIPLAITKCPTMTTMTTILVALASKSTNLINTVQRSGTKQANCIVTDNSSHTLMSRRSMCGRCARLRGGSRNCYAITFYKALNPSMRVCSMTSVSLMTLRSASVSGMQTRGACLPQPSLSLV